MCFAGNDISIRGKRIGVIPEIKHPRHYNEIWGPRFFEDEVLRVLEKHGYPGKGNVVIQNFDFESLEYIRTKSDVDLCLLVMFNSWVLTPKGLDKVGKVVTSVGPWKEFLVNGIEPELIMRDRAINQTEIAELGGFIDPKKLVDEIHHRNMDVIIYTIYDSREPSNRGCSIKCENLTKKEELEYFFRMGVDGIFCENLPECILARDTFGF